LKYNGYGNLVIPTTALHVGARYRPTSAYDVDPLLGSTATPGFNEWAAFYSNYRVTMSKIRIRFSNASTLQGALVVICPLNADPGASPSGATVSSWIESPYSKHDIVGTAGSSPTTLTCEMSTEKLFGSKMVYFDDNFTSLVTTNPVNNWYWGLGAIGPLAPASTQNIQTLIDIELGVEFFSRKILAS
jgi:hypothetical protein